ncbi:type II secretion system F family protein [Variovorax sp. LARHSF232]
MLNHLGGDTLVTVTVLVFVTVLLLLEGLYLLWRSRHGREARQLRERMRTLAEPADAQAQARLRKHRSQDELPWLERTLLSLPRAAHLEHLIQQAGKPWRPVQVLLSSALLGVGGLLAAHNLARLPLLIAVALGFTCVCLPLIYLRVLRQKRLQRFEQQLPEALDLIGRALRAGHSFGTGIQMVSEEMSEPIAGEFRLVSEEVNFGVALQQALNNLGERVPLTDLRYFVVAVLIQRDSGGNLTEVLGNLSRLVRERHKLLAKVRVLSAEGRLSAWILGLMPFALAFLLNMFSPDFVAPLWTDPIGHTMLKVMAGLMLTGIVLLRYLVRIRV